MMSMNMFLWEHSPQSRIKVHFVATFLNIFFDSNSLVLFKILATFDLIIFLKNMEMVSNKKCINRFRILRDFVNNVQNTKWTSILS